MVITVLQIISAILLITTIMLQAPGSGLSPVFGGGGEAYRSKRNAQRFLTIATIVLCTLLGLLSLAQLVFQTS